MAINNTTEHDNSIRYYFSSIDLPVEELAKIIRKHWQIENNLHWFHNILLISKVKDMEIRKWYMKETIYERSIYI